MKSWKAFASWLILATGLCAGANSLFAQAEPEVLSSLTAQWWQYVLSTPTTVNPLVDTTGADCMVGQRGPIWFLMGTFFGGTVARKCTIPAGEALFFPVINSVQINSPGVCGQAGAVDVSALRAAAAAFIDGAANLSVQVDGKKIANLLHIQSDVFATTFPADNIFNAPCVAAGLGTVPAGVYSPSVDEGYYVLLPPLSAGSHALRIHAENPSQAFVLNVTYMLNVAPAQLR
jgi:hypothetical protein